jgi:uncharacterized protein YcfJ
MKRIPLAIAALFTAAAPAAFAQYDRYDSRYDNREYLRDRDDRRAEFARVIESRPVYADGSGREECFNPRTGYYEEVRNRDNRIGKGAAIGAVAGGVLGHQVDQGGGTAAGAIIGGLLGHHLERRSDRHDQSDLDMSRCRTLADSGNLQGYEVRYEYRGEEYVTRMNHEPGRRLRVGEDINWDGSPRDGQVASYSQPSYTWR